VAASIAEAMNLKKTFTIGLLEKKRTHFHPSEGVLTLSIAQA
jgi:hypothetical protein